MNSKYHPWKLDGATCKWYQVSPNLSILLVHHEFDSEKADFSKVRLLSKLVLRFTLKAASFGRYSSKAWKVHVITSCATSQPEVQDTRPAMKTSENHPKMVPKPCPIHSPFIVFIAKSLRFFPVTPLKILWTKGQILVFGMATMFDASSHQDLDR